MAKQDLVQILNPKSKTWVVIDRNLGQIIKHSPTAKPYKNIKIIDKNTPEYEHGIEPIHGWFELTYAQYLTIPRSVLQSMPIEWQARFVECLTELDDTIDWRPKDACYWCFLKPISDNEDDDSEIPAGFIEDPLADYERGDRRIPHKTKECPLCGKESPDGFPHKECADREQCLSDQP